MKKVGRNEPCPCGSGKKYKNCHMKEEAKKEVNNKTMMYLAFFILFIIIGAIGYYFNTKPKPQDEPPPKVWSEEHQHYH